MSTLHEHASYRAIATDRAQRFLETRNSEAAQWTRHHPDQPFPAAAIRLTTVPARCDCGFCTSDLLLSDRPDPCVFEVWTRAMEAAGLPPRPYAGERAHLAYLAQQREAEVERDRHDRRRQELIARLIAPYPEREVWQVPWVNVPRDQVAAFWAAEREGAAEAWLDARDAASGGMQSYLVERAVEREQAKSSRHPGPHSSAHEEDEEREPRRPASRKSSSRGKRRSKTGQPPHPFPYPRHSAKRTGNSAFMRSVWRWGRVEALRALNAAQDAGEPIPDEPGLVEWLVDLIEDRGAKYIASSYDRQSSVRYPNEILDLDVEPTAVAVIKYVLDEWVPTYLEDARRRGAAGGRNGRRGPTFTPDLLDDLRGLTAREQAAALGCSVRKIFDLRRQRAEQGYAN